MSENPKKICEDFEAIAQGLREIEEDKQISRSGLDEFGNFPEAKVTIGTETGRISVRPPAAPLMGLSPRKLLHTACTECNGTGQSPTGSMGTPWCGSCLGHGFKTNFQGPEEMCPSCYGTGNPSSPAQRSCSWCGGKGKVPVMLQTDPNAKLCPPPNSTAGINQLLYPIPCSACQGVGRTRASGGIIRTCQRCSGTGAEP